MDNIIISPWTDRAEQNSPNRKIRAEFINGHEIAMGAPTSGELWLYTEGGTKEKISSNAGASFIWSDDSKYLAYSEWTEYKTQIVRVIKIQGMVDKSVNDEMVVIQFESFKDHHVKGIDSPIHQPRRFQIDALKLFIED